MQELNAPFTAEEIKSISEDPQLSQSAESIANYINDIMDDMYKKYPNFRNCIDALIIWNDEIMEDENDRE